MVALVPADFVVLSVRDARVALVCARFTAKRESSDGRRAAAALAADLERELSACGRLTAAVADIGARSGSPEVNGVLSVAEAGVILSLGARQVRRLLVGGLLRGEKVAGVWIIERASVDEVVEERRAS